MAEQPRPWDDPYGGYDSYNRYESDAGHYENDPRDPSGQRKIFIYGKSGAQKDVEEAEALGGRMLDRGAAQADYGDYQYGLGETQKGMGYQTEGLNMYRDAAMGNAPSRAEIAGKAAMDRASSGQMAAAGTVRGGAMQQAAAYRNAARINAANDANMTQNIAAERAAEMERARAGFQQGAQGYTQAGLGYTGAGLQKSGQQLQNEQFQRGLNQQAFQYHQSAAARTKEQDVAARQGKTASDLAQSRADEESRSNREKEGIGKAQAITGIVPSDERTKEPATLSDMGAKRPARLSDAQAQGLSKRADSMIASTRAATANRPAAVRDTQQPSTPEWLHQAREEYDAKSKGDDEKLNQMLTARSGVSAPRQDNFLDREMARERKDDIRRVNDVTARNRYKPKPDSYDSVYGVGGAPKGYAASRMGQEGSMFSYGDPVEVKSKKQAERNEEVAMSDERAKNVYSDMETKDPNRWTDAEQDEAAEQSPFEVMSSFKKKKGLMGLMSDERSKDIKKEGSSISFKGGNVFAPQTTEEPEPEEEKGTTRIGVSDSASPSMGEGGNAIKAITHDDERLKPKEFSDNRAKLEEAYRYGRQAGRNELTADMEKTARLPKEAVDRNVKEGDRASTAVANARDKTGVKAETMEEARTQKALSDAQGSVRRAYVGAYKKGEPLGRVQGTQAGPEPGVRKLTTIGPARGKDQLSIQRSAYDAEQQGPLDAQHAAFDAEQAKQAEAARVAAAAERVAPSPYRKTLPSGEVVEGRQASDMGTKNMIQPSDARTKEDAARKMEGTPYSYKEEYRPKEQEPGEVNVGPMAQNLEKNPITATTVKKDPKTGMRMVDMAKLVKVQSTEIAHLQNQIDGIKYGDPKNDQLRQDADTGPSQWDRERAPARRGAPADAGPYQDPDRVGGSVLDEDWGNDEEMQASAPTRMKKVARG